MIGKTVFSLAIIFCAALTGFAVTNVNHWDIQAVSSTGAPPAGYPYFADRVRFQGVVLNRPAYMIDASVEPNNGEWQVFIQGLDGDHAGTALYMRQDNQSVSGTGIYTDAQWDDELDRLNHDNTDTDYVFVPGDIVEVEGLLKFYRGKANLNERHDTNPDNDFTVTLIEPGYGFVEPEVITLSDVKDGNDVDIFDPNRTSGGEFYQSRLVRINDVNIADPENWGPDTDRGALGTVTIRDATGRTLPVKFGIGRGFEIYDAPTGQIDVIGIFDQEAPGSFQTGFDLTAGYRVWVCDYDGNGKVLADRRGNITNVQGDVNYDGRVDLVDLAVMSGGWLGCMPGYGDCD